MDLYTKCGGCDREGRVSTSPGGAGAKDTLVTVRPPDGWEEFDKRLLCGDCVIAARRAVVEVLYKRLTRAAS